MSTDIKAPTFPESVQDGTVATWHKQPGEAVARDELIVDIETDKVVLEVVPPADGSLEKILKNEGDTVLSNEVIATFKAGAGGDKTDDKDGKEEKAEKDSKGGKGDDSGDNAEKKTEDAADTGADEKILSPAARKMADENNLKPADIKGTGKDGRVTKEDVVNHLSSANAKPAPAEKSASAPVPVAAEGDRVEKRVPMTRLRKRIAERLLEAT